LGEAIPSFLLLTLKVGCASVPKLNHKFQLTNEKRKKEKVKEKKRGETSKFVPIHEVTISTSTASTSAKGTFFLSAKSACSKMPFARAIHAGHDATTAFGDF
jgi:hypothetical protein